MAASKSDRERASRLRRRAREGGELSARDRKWLERYEAENKRVARRVKRAPEPIAEAELVEAESAEAASAPDSEPEMVEIAGELPAAAPEPPLASSGPAAAPVPGAPPVGGPLPTLHRAPCPGGPDCPGCAGLLEVRAAICVTTGREVWPAIGEDEAEGWAHALLEGIGLLVRWVARAFFKRKLRAVDPTSLEIQRVSRALRVAARRRPMIAELAHSGGDLVSLLMTGRKFAARSWEALPAEGSSASGD